MFISFYIIYYSKAIVSLYNNINYSNDYLYNLTSNLNTVEFYFEKYLLSGQTEILNAYLKNKYFLEETLEKITPDITRSEKDIILSNIKNMVNSYLEYNEKVIYEKKIDNTTAYLKYGSICSEILEYLESDIQRVYKMQIKNNNNLYNKFVSNLNIIQLYIILETFIIAIYCLYLNVHFSYNITKSLQQLSASANMIAKGNFDIGKITVESEDEIGLVATAFNKMTDNITALIKEITQKADIENKLKIKEVENLQINNMLKETKLQALQSQINPHFLFNTLNAIAQTAMFEDAKETYNLINAISGILRYNLRNFNKPVSIQQEIENVTSYLHILKARYSRRFDYTINVDYCDEIYIPCLTLQPIAENSFIHGLEPKDGPGKIEINVIQQQDSIIISIRDDGVGMEQRQVEKIISGYEQDEQEQKHKGHVTGIGLNNVKRRLDLYYNCSINIDVDSAIGKGTTVKLTIPVRKENRDAKAFIS
ncbi:MAG: integral rane sensor signal transduction histidine kinase [Thermoanaerobacter sp.]|jgi:sensor histidine kinase YesM|nr:integral rane sensor signal transduction histidine kinase [Thermoanaerobacter sp.]